MMGWVVALWTWMIGGVHRFVGRLGKRPARPGRLDVASARTLTPPAHLRSPHEELFAFPAPPVPEEHAQLWEAVGLALPEGYTIPDPDFQRVLAMQSVMRTIRLIVPFDSPDAATIVAGPATWSPPYRLPTVTPHPHPTSALPALPTYAEEPRAPFPDPRPASAPAAGPAPTPAPVAAPTRAPVRSSGPRRPQMSQKRLRPR